MQKLSSQKKNVQALTELRRASPSLPEFQPQQSPLHPPHLLHAYLMLIALRSTGKQWMAFYNCGELAGASQKRRQCVLSSLPSCTVRDLFVGRGPDPDRHAPFFYRAACSSSPSRASLR